MHASCAGPVHTHGLDPQSNLISIHSRVESEKYLGGLHLGLNIKHTQVNSARKTRHKILNRKSKSQRRLYIVCILPICTVFTYYKHPPALLRQSNRALESPFFPTGNTFANGGCSIGMLD